MKPLLDKMDKEEQNSEQNFKQRDSVQAPDIIVPTFQSATEQTTTDTAEADSNSASHDIPRLLRNAAVHNLVHKSLQLVSILSQKNPIHTFPPYLSNIRFNIIFCLRVVSSDQVHRPLYFSI